MEEYSSLAPTNKGCGWLNGHWDALTLDQKIGWYVVILVVVLIIIEPVIRRKK